MIPATDSLPLAASRTFARAAVGGEAVAADDAGYKLWIDAAFLGAGEIEMAYEDMPADEVGIALHIPAARLDRTQPNPVYRNVRLETGRGGLWITPAFVIGLFTTPAAPGFVFIRLAEKIGDWIKVQGEPGPVAALLSIHLQLASAAKAKPALPRRASR